LTGRAVYTHGHAEPVLRAHCWRTAENSAAYLLPSLTRGMSLLDVGCGPGSVTVDLARRLAPGRVVGIDPNADVVAQAASQPDGSLVEWVANDLDGYVAAEQFDVVHAHQVLQHLADPVGALRAMARRCVPGGLVAARDGDYAGFVWYPHLPELDEWMSLYQQAARANGGEPDAGRRLLAWARAAGFRDVTATSSTWCFADPDSRSWWGDTWADRILGSALTRQLVDTHLATTADLRRIAAGWRRWARHEDGWISVPSGEILCRTDRCGPMARR
jgi:SAM-dependent methyltransferase